MVDERGPRTDHDEEISQAGNTRRDEQQLNHLALDALDCHRHLGRHLGSSLAVTPWPSKVSGPVVFSPHTNLPPH